MSNTIQSFLSSPKASPEASPKVSNEAPHATDATATVIEIATITGTATTATTCKLSNQQSPRNQSASRQSTKVARSINCLQRAFLPRLKRLSLLGACIVLATPAYAANVFINEFHYDNAGGDVNEGVEIAGESGLSLDGWQIQLYNGGDGSVYRTQLLSGTFLDQSEGYGTLAFNIVGIQNGPADAFALVNEVGELAEFISYEGSVTATNGAANGQSSDDVGILEATSSPVGNSIQRIGMGSQADDFNWSISESSFGEINSGQSISQQATTIPLPAASWLFAGALMLLGRLKNSDSNYQS